MGRRNKETWDRMLGAVAKRAAACRRTSRRLARRNRVSASVPGRARWRSVTSRWSLSACPHRSARDARAAFRAARAAYDEAPSEAPHWQDRRRNNPTEPARPALGAASSPDPRAWPTPGRGESGSALGPAARRQDTAAPKARPYNARPDAEVVVGRENSIRGALTRQVSFDSPKEPIVIEQLVQPRQHRLEVQCQLRRQRKEVHRGPVIP